MLIKSHEFASQIKKIIKNNQFVNKAVRRNLLAKNKSRPVDKDLSSWGGPGGTKAAHFCKTVTFGI